MNQNKKRQLIIDHMSASGLRCFLIQFIPSHKITIFWGGNERGKKRGGCLSPYLKMWLFLFFFPKKKKFGLKKRNVFSLGVYRRRSLLDPRSRSFLLLPIDVVVWGADLDSRYTHTDGHMWSCVSLCPCTMYRREEQMVSGDLLFTCVYPPPTHYTTPHFSWKKSHHMNVDMQLFWVRRIHFIRIPGL